jgi:hypothetical protein
MNPSRSDQRMTSLPPTAPSNAAADAIALRLDEAQTALRGQRILISLCGVATILLPLLLIAALIAGLGHLTGWPIWAIDLILLAAAGTIYCRFVHPAWRTMTLAETARAVEQRAANQNQPLHNQLINAVLLPDGNADNRWTPHLLNEVAAGLIAEPLTRFLDRTAVDRAFKLAGAALLGVALISALAWPTVAHGLAVLASPAQFIPRTGAVQISEIVPQNDTVLAGQSVSFSATVTAPDHRTVPALVTVTLKSGNVLKLPMVTNANNSVAYTLPSLAEDANYVISAGDTQSPQYHLSVLPEIHVKQMSWSLTPPDYLAATTDHAPATVDGKSLDAAHVDRAAPLGSIISLTVSLDLPVNAVLLDSGPTPIALAAGAESNTYTTAFPLKETLHYAILIQDARGRTLKRLPDDNGTFTLTATPDDPPTVTVAAPGRDIDALPGTYLDLQSTCTDDHGLTQIALQTAPATPTDAPFTTIKTWPISEDTQHHPALNAMIRYTLDLPSNQYRLGDALRYRFTATDNRALTSVDPTFTAQTTFGQVYTIAFSDKNAEAAQESAAWEQLRKKLQAILDHQIALRTTTLTLLPTLPLSDIHTHAGELATGQGQVTASINDVVDHFPFLPGMALVRKTLPLIVAQDASPAEDRAHDLALLANPQTLSPIAIGLRDHQSRIIDALQALLAIVAAQKDHALDASAQAGEAPPDQARQHWQKMLDSLASFEKSQRAVIDATADLAKKPKDQFDQNDDKKLASLIATQDKWEKFLNESMVDLSKISEQDQTNASLLDELVQMKVELTASKNALETKQMVAATALEDNGLELAKGLTTHIERWLMNTPDRTAWQMEEPLTQNDPPMAELPKQLQDMMGDLMDNEEDLTQQMESLGSKSVDSLDKGAGWDASDGPISNMSAQGVTGNQMPKDMEIQGRSGEGREGRSSGEMVGAEAEGKGGRRTPTRMTNDAFSSGQVQDHSKDPAGGATGGGKKAGFGGEGLEGAAPDEQKNGMQRLQGRQAALRNDAEKLKLQMRANHYDNFKLLEAAVLMQKADQAMQAYRYHTALYYQSQAVDALQTAKTLAGGEAAVTLDTSAGATQKMPQQMQDVLNGSLPNGYGDPVKAYFEKLSGGDTPSN